MAPQNRLGIDFGTSNSAAGILVNGKPYLIELEHGEKTIPTSVFFDFENQCAVFGNAANAALIQGHEGRFMRALKSVLGTSLMHEERRILGETLSVMDITSRFLAEIKSRAEASCHMKFDHALSGRPVRFHSNDALKDAQALKDLTECYHRAGFQHVDFMFEPEAAALANGATAHSGAIGLIVDIGGGTSDFSVFKNDKDHIEILASEGIRIGGTDFDRSISVDHVMPLFGKGTQIRNEMGKGTLEAPNALFQDLATWQKIPFQYTSDIRKSVERMKRFAVEKDLFSRLNAVLEYELGHEIAFAVERGKIEANKANERTIGINLAFVESALAAPISRNDVQNSLSGYAEKIGTCAKDTIKKAGYEPEQVNIIIFVGGSSLMSIIEQTLTNICPRAQLHYSDAFTAVVDGLAIASAR